MAWGGGVVLELYGVLQERYEERELDLILYICTYMYFFVAYVLMKPMIEKSDRRE